MTATLGWELAAGSQARLNEVWTKEQTEAAGLVHKGSYVISPLPQDYIKDEDVPTNFTWGDQDGVNMLTMSRNQHIPQYCGSCWAHGSVSALGDRVKIARKGKGIDINLSVQHILNCGNVGSCHGGSVDGPYQWLHSVSQKGEGISYETSNPYMACSSESQEGFCPHADWSCKATNVARTCSTFPPSGFCGPIKQYPNVSISEYGSVEGANNMAKEIMARGPISCGIDASPILKYTGGIASMAGEQVDHVISVVGWGTEGNKEYWIVRNSWGEYWGEMGYIRVEKGNNALQLETQCAWAVPKAWTELDNQVRCFEDGTNCGSKGPSPSPSPPSPPSPSPSPSPPSPSPSKPRKHYEDPAITGSCHSGEESVTIQGLSGDFCSPSCSTSTPCPSAGKVAGQGKCILQTSGSPGPTNCAIVCDPSANQKQCPNGASCQSIQGTGICTYPAKVNATSMFFSK